MNEVLCLSRRPRQCTLSVSGNALQLVNHVPIGAVFTSDGRQNKEIDTRIGKANEVLRELYCFVVTKRERSYTAKLFFLIGFCSHLHLLS